MASDQYGNEVERRRRSFPSISVRRGSLAIVLATMMLGQVTMMEEMGVLDDLLGLYQISIWFVFVYAFWPQIRFVLSRALNKLVNRFEGAES